MPSEFLRIQLLMRIAFLYNRAADDPANFAEDDAPDRSPVVAALQHLGHEITPIECTLDLAAVRRELMRAKPDVAFNRVESLGGSDAITAAITLLLDVMQIPYTGCPTQAMVAAANKLSVKERIGRAGLPTPEWITGDFGFRIAVCGLQDSSANPKSAIRNPQYIIKSVYEHASFHMDEASIVGPALPDEIAKLVVEQSAKYGRPFFAERFIDGREFNLSLVGNGPEVLPPAEIDFSAFPRGKPQIVGHGAKWDHASFEYNNTPGRFDFPPHDAPLLRRLTDLAVQCWRLFDLRGYARIDFRCDAASEPWILEINTNPCLSPASGFAAALEKVGIGYEGGIQLILDEAISRCDKSTRPMRRPSASLSI